MTLYHDHKDYMLSMQEKSPQYFATAKKNRIEASKVPIKQRAPFGVREKLAGQFVVYDNAGWPMLELQTGEPMTREFAEHICKALNMLYAHELMNGSDEVVSTDPYPAQHRHGPGGRR